MNLSGYNQLEQLSDDELDYLETSILARLSGYVNVVRLYVVGSFCFGLDKVNDIDIVVCISEDDVIINQDQHDTSGVFYMIKDIYSGLLSRDLSIKVSMIPNNWGKFLSNDVKRVKPPYFDLTVRLQPFRIDKYIFADTAIATREHSGINEYTSINTC